MDSNTNTDNKLVIIECWPCTDTADRERITQSRKQNAQKRLSKFRTLLHSNRIYTDLKFGTVSQWNAIDFMEEKKIFFEQSAINATNIPNTLSK